MADTDPIPVPTPDDVKQVEELLAMRGKFYTLNGESYCDTATETWKLIPFHGYVRIEDGHARTIADAGLR